MPIPDFQTIMLPLLEMFRDGEAKTTTQMYAELGDHFGLTEQERTERLPSGNQTRFQNRVGWARTHLKKARLLERIGSGLYKIAPRGKEVLASTPPKIDVHFLDQFEEHLEFRKAKKPKIETLETEALGLDVIYIQAKRWAGTVGRPEIQAFVGSLEGHRANKGVFITTSHFSPDAKDYVSQIGKKIVLIDGEQLSEMMMDHDVGVTTEDSYVVKKIDSDYFSEE